MNVVSDVVRLKVRNASKVYGGVHAIRNIDVDIRAGEIFGLLGENGAGKSTLCKAIAGAVRLTSGQMWLDGKELNYARPADALADRIVMVYQESSLVPSMTVAQNVVLGQERLVNRLKTLYKTTQATLRALNFNVDPTALVSSLGTAQRQMVEIARAVHNDVRLIIFDEPTATLTPAEKRNFFRLLRSLRANGVSVIYISHALEETLTIADRVMVLRDGEPIVTGDASGFTRETIIRHMVGRTINDTYYATQLNSRDRFQQMRKGEKKLPVVLRVENLRMGGMVRSMSFSVRAGEVTGIAGLIGAGRTEAAKVVSGVLKRDMTNGGRVLLEGRPVRYRTPEQAVADGIVYVTEDRKLDGFFETMAPYRNIHIGWLAKARRLWSPATGRDAARVANPWVERMNVRMLDPRSRLVELSGGNQQKVVIAKSLCQKPKIVFFDEPTRGVDVGSITEIHDFIRSLASDGIAVVVISSYLPEILSISDRVLVARQGQIVEEFPVHEASQDKIMNAAVA
ncbi:simple sugar transport system ATP-binding protein [Roseiarcus fermentans]|uniref:Simple sugar transport system ATP-binding protein n=1 Tax=Roseiarcus fermentans TaxID=1473586 RepID=A0A366FLD7_9HYPH|nr:sugar ABC transporter ATP-binding protein [Roseiarcus fermentans]RBP15513.1 simple sugar transport system ATP-binding protein [Roseiarcus fermentans]